jgi:hypothetical protein
MKCPFEMNWEKVSPAVAALWLKEHNTHNRPLRAATVRAFAQDMVANKWAPTHQGIAFGRDGVLKDGQHRLAAIVTSRKPIWLWVARGVPDFVEDADQGGRVMDAIDRGNTRSIGDLLRLEHGLQVNPNLAAAICLQIARCGTRCSVERTKKATMPQTVAILEMFHAEVTWAMNEIRKAPTHVKQASVFGALALAYRAEPEGTAAFARSLITGAGLAEGSPALTLRNDLYRDPGSNSCQARRDTGLKVLHALYHYLANKPLVRMPRQEFDGAVWVLNKLGKLRDEIEVLFPALADEGAAVREARRLKRLHANESTSEQLLSPTKTVPAIPAIASNRSEARTDAKTWKPTAAAERLLQKAGGR